MAKLIKYGKWRLVRRVKPKGRIKLGRWILLGRKR